MDKFDSRVQQARETYEPSPGFVDRTMGEVKKHKVHRRRFGLKIWAPAAASVVAVLAIAIILVPKSATNVADGSKNSQHLAKAAQATPTASPAAITDGTDNASLEGDLNNIQASMGQSAGDQSSVDGAVNDNQQEISIPTN